MYGTFCRCALRIFFCIRSSVASTSTRMPRSRSCAATLQVVDVRVGDRDADHLDRRQPRRERARVVLDQDPEEPLDRAEQRPVDHDRLAAGSRPRPGTPARTAWAAGSRAGWWTAARSGRSRPWPGPRSSARRTRRRPGRGPARARTPAAASRSVSVASSQSSSLPTNLSWLVAGGQLQVEVGQAVVAQQVEHERQQPLQLAAHLLAGAEDVRVVLGQAAGPGQPVHDAGLLVPVHGAELEQPQRQLAVGPAAGGEIRMWNGQFIGLR